MAAILRAPFSSFRLADLMDMTDRQLYEIFVEGVDNEKVDSEPSHPRAMQGSQPNTYKDATGLTWDLPPPKDTPLTSVDGRPMDGETALKNFAKMGLLKWEDVNRVLAERQAHLESKNGGSGDGSD